MEEIMHTLVECTGTNNSFLAALRELAEFDCDFNGENGPEYLRKEAMEAGADSNLDYIINMLHNEIEEGISHVDALHKFFKYWLETDSYYGNYSFKYLANKNNEVRVISLAVSY